MYDLSIGRYTNRTELCIVKNGVREWVREKAREWGSGVGLKSVVMDWGERVE